VITYTQKATVRCSAPVAGDSAPRQCKATCEATLRFVAGKDGVTRLCWVDGIPEGWSCHKYVPGVLWSSEREAGVYLGCEEHADPRKWAP